MSNNVSKEEVAKFSDDMVQWWDEKGPMKVLHQINPTRIKYLQKFCDISGKKLLDVGCGGGIYSEGLAKLGAHVTGIDANSSAIAVATKHAEQSDLSIEYHHTYIEEFNPEHQFDVITCMELLEHVPSPEDLIKECVRCLKPGGIFCLSTINRTLKAYAFAILGAEYILGLIPKKTHDYDKLIRPSELERIISSAGCYCIDIKGMAYNPLSGESWLQDDVAINYFMCCRKYDRQTAA